MHVIGRAGLILCVCLGLWAYLYLECSFLAYSRLSMIWGMVVALWCRFLASTLSGNNSKFLVDVTKKRV